MRSATVEQNHEKWVNQVGAVGEASQRYESFPS